MSAHPMELAAVRQAGTHTTPPCVLDVEPLRAWIERLPPDGELPKAPDGTPIRATMRERHEAHGRVVVEIFAATFMDCARGCARYAHGRPVAAYGTNFEIVERQPGGLFRAWGTRNAVENLS